VPNAFCCLSLTILVLWGVASGKCQTPGPSNVRDCRPCSFSPGDGFPPYSFTFDLKTEGDERTVEAIEVTSEGSHIQRLPVTGMHPIGMDEDFFFGGQDINFDGLLDLILITQRGGANADAEYWLFNPQTKSFESLGNYPIFTVDAEKKRLNNYVRGGLAGLIYESREYAFVDKKLTLMREEKQQATKDPHVFLKVVRERVGGVMKVVKTEKVQAPP
jgi:hypothetical protein